MAIAPYADSMWLPLVPELFAKVAHPVGVVLRAAGQEANALLLDQATDVVGRMATIEEFDMVRFTHVLDAAEQLPALQGSADLIDLLILFEDHLLPKEQRRPIELRIELLLEGEEWDERPSGPPARGFHLPPNYRGRLLSGTE